MRYFFLAYALIVVLVIGNAGVRGQKFSHAPIELFNDMDRQDKVKSQEPDAFFADGNGSRLPVANTTASHFDNEAKPAPGATITPEFGFSNNRVGYYYTGKFDQNFGTGLPPELGLNADNIDAFLRRGEERYGIYCSSCHGQYGNGKGTVAQAPGFPTVANLLDDSKTAPTYPDGQIYKTINEGKGNMGPLGYNIPVRDRWAIVAYVRAMQHTQRLTDAEKESIRQSK